MNNTGYISKIYSYSDNPWISQMKEQCYHLAGYVTKTEEFEKWFLNNLENKIKIHKSPHSREWDYVENIIDADDRVGISNQDILENGDEAYNDHDGPHIQPIDIEEYDEYYDWIGKGNIKDLEEYFLIYHPPSLEELLDKNSRVASLLI